MKQKNSLLRKSFHRLSQRIRILTYLSFCHLIIREKIEQCVFHIGKITVMKPRCHVLNYILPTLLTDIFKQKSSV